MEITTVSGSSCLHQNAQTASTNPPNLSKYHVIRIVYLDTVGMVLEIIVKEQVSLSSMATWKNLTICSSSSHSSFFMAWRIHLCKQSSDTDTQYNAYSIDRNNVIVFHSLSSDKIFIMNSTQGKCYWQTWTWISTRICAGSITTMDCFLCVWATDMLLTPLHNSTHQRNAMHQERF